MGNYPEAADFNEYIINGVYSSDVKLLFSTASKEELLIMIKRGFLGLEDPACARIDNPVSWRDFVFDTNKKFRWADVQCPFHETQSGTCAEITEKSVNGYPPCVILTHYLTARLILKDR